MTTAALAALLVPELRRAGRWLLSWLLDEGFRATVQFIGYRIKTFEKRITRMWAKPKPRTKVGMRARYRRHDWLRWRIAWRKKLLTWLKKNKARLTSTALRKLEKAANDQIYRIPWDKAGERFETWRRKRAA